MFPNPLFQYIIHYLEKIIQEIFALNIVYFPCGSYHIYEDRIIGGTYLKILEYMIERKQKRLKELEMQCIQDNYKLVMLQSENSKRQQR